jgi:hypothetical protein
MKKIQMLLAYSILATAAVADLSENAVIDAIRTQMIAANSFDADSAVQTVGAAGITVTVTSGPACSTNHFTRNQMSEAIRSFYAAINQTGYFLSITPMAFSRIDANTIDVRMRTIEHYTPRSSKQRVVASYSEVARFQRIADHVVIVQTLMSIRTEELQQTKDSHGSR